MSCGSTLCNCQHVLCVDKTFCSTGNTSVEPQKEDIVWGEEETHWDKDATEVLHFLFGNLFVPQVSPFAPPREADSVIPPVRPCWHFCDRKPLLSTKRKTRKCCRGLHKSVCRNLAAGPLSLGSNWWKLSVNSGVFKCWWCLHLPP